MAVVLIVWIGVRLATRRPILHPWLATIVLVGLAAVAGSFSESGSGPAAHVSYSLSAFLGLSGIVSIGEGLRWELNGRRTGRPGLLAIGAVCLTVAIVCGFLSPPRDHLLAHTAGSAYLLNLLSTLFTAKQRRVGCRLIAAGIIAYACTRTALLAIDLHGGNVFAKEQVADTVVILLIGTGLIAFVAGRAKKSISRRHASHRPFGEPPS